jgi:hypothetical protein
MMLMGKLYTRNYNVVGLEVVTAVALEYNAM